MTFTCQIREQRGVWTVERGSLDVDPSRITGATRDEAPQKMEGEIRYWLEICPCGGQALRNLDIELECEPTGAFSHNK
jgi:hypothetical protein